MNNDDGSRGGRRAGTRRTSAEIEQEIGRARAEIDLTLEALDRRLAARQLVEDGVEMMKQSITQSELWGQGIEVIRANPIPVALIGVGVAWLVASSTGMGEAVARDERARAAGRKVAELATDVGSRAAALATDAAHRVGIGGAGGGAQPQSLGGANGTIAGNGSAARANGGTWMHQASEAAQDAIRSTREAGEAAYERAKDYAKTAGEQATRFSDQVGDAFARHPLLIGGIALMAGALIGAMLPRTRTEDAWVGSARDKLLEKAEETGHQAVVRLREATEGAASGEKSASD